MFLQTVIKELNLKFEIKENLMGSKQRRLSYTTAFKIEVVNYIEKHGNRAAERRFGSPPTEKMIREWRKQRKDLIKPDKSKKTLCSCAPKWPKLKMSITDFAGTTSWCERFTRRNSLCMRTKTTTAQKLPREYKRKIIEFHKYVINMRKKLCFETG